MYLKDTVQFTYKRSTLFSPRLDFVLLSIYTVSNARTESQFYEYVKLYLALNIAVSSAMLLVSYKYHVEIECGTCERSRLVPHFAYIYQVKNSHFYLINHPNFYIFKLIFNSFKVFLNTYNIYFKSQSLL